MLTRTNCHIFLDGHIYCVRNEARHLPNLMKRHFGHEIIALEYGIDVESDNVSKGGERRVERHLVVTIQPSKRLANAQ